MISHVSSRFFFFFLRRFTPSFSLFWYVRLSFCHVLCVRTRFEAYGWHTQTVSDVTDAAALMKAIENAKAETGKPSIIKTKTIIGHGSLKQVSNKSKKKKVVLLYSYRRAVCLYVNETHVAVCDLD